MKICWLISLFVSLSAWGSDSILGSSVFEGITPKMSKKELLAVLKSGYEETDHYVGKKSEVLGHKASVLYYFSKKGRLENIGVLLHDVFYFSIRHPLTFKIWSEMNENFPLSKAALDSSILDQTNFGAVVYYEWSDSKRTVVLAEGTFEGKKVCLLHFTYI